MRWLPLLFLLGCAGELAADPAVEPEKPNPCGMPEFNPGECRDEVLNDGRGPDDHRKVCQVGPDQWILYPSGEVFHLDTAAKTTVCHALPDGRLCAAVVCP